MCPAPRSAPAVYENSILLADKNSGGYIFFKELTSSQKKRQIFLDLIVFKCNTKEPLQNYTLGLQSTKKDKLTE